MGNIMIFRWEDGTACDFSCLDDFTMGLNQGKYQIIEHTVEYEKCSGKTIQKFKIRKIDSFDIVKEWTHKNSKAIKCRLSEYEVYLRFNDGLLIISDKGVLIDKRRIWNALNIPYVPISEIPCYIINVGQTVCENKMVLNMTKLMEVIEEYKCC